jgi:hypothetical protein
VRILLHLEENGLDMALALLASALRLNKTTAVRRNLRPSVRHTFH